MSLVVHVVEALVHLLRRRKARARVALGAWTANLKSLSAVRVPGEIVEVTILREGQEKGEGVGFLEDGSMVVVADAAELVGENLKVRITGSASTPRGRICPATCPRSAG